MLSLDVPSAYLVCRPCRHDVTRALANSCYVPRWRKDASKVSTKSSDCCVATCSNTVFAVSTVATGEEIQHAFDSTGLKCGNDAIPTPTRKGGRTTGARGALAPLKFAENGLSPLMLWPCNTDCLLK